MSKSDIYREALRLEREVENRKTQAIAFESALTALRQDLLVAGNPHTIELLDKRIQEALEYIKIWTR